MIETHPLGKAADTYARIVSGKALDICHPPMVVLRNLEGQSYETNLYPASIRNVRCCFNYLRSKPRR
jgi:hypothetical protein